jgi:hypothetical protein
MANILKLSTEDGSELCLVKSEKTHLADKALKSMYEVLKIERMYKLSIKCLLDLFYKMNKPILLYGCEVWGFSNNDILEKIHLKLCKGTTI